MTAAPLLVVGLRNPGEGYQGTRHNVGAEVIERLADSAPFKRAPRRARCELAQVEMAERPVILALPLTFMNDSGSAVQPVMRYFGVDPSDLLLVHDDIDLPFAKLRVQFSRGPGGHNGVASVVRSLGSVELWRLKLGVGRPPGRMDPADFVLRSFYPRERDDVDLMVAEAADVVRVFAEQGSDAARQAAGDASARRAHPEPQ